MGLRQIREEGEEILRKKSRDVSKDEITSEKIQTLVDDMIETMREYNGVGLSAVQVGLLKRVVVIQVEENGPVYVLINPIITKTKGERECDEGCLSFPNQFGKVLRPSEVTVEFYNREGKKDKLKAKDLLAQAICHGCDHLEGILFVDKVLPGTLEYATPEQS